MKYFLPILLFCISFLQAQNVYATFNVIAKKDAKLAFVTSGRVDAVKVDIGSVVKKSQILATLDNKDTKAILE